MNIEILSPESTLFSGEGSSISLPGVKGRFQILERHAPLVSTLGKGEVVVETPEGKKSFSINGGFVEVLKNKVVVLA